MSKHGWYWILSQDQVWIDASRTSVPIEQMSVKYKDNVVNFLIKRASALAVYYTYSELEAAFAPDGREVIGFLGGEPVLGDWVPGGPRGDMAKDAFDAEMDQAFEYRTEHPVKWLSGTPLMQRLVHDVENDIGGHIE